MRYRLFLSCLFPFMLSGAVITAQVRDVDIQPYTPPEGVVNVKDFGAKGDGKTDETESFQKALDSFGIKGGTVIVPRGLYLFKGHIIVPNGVALKGSWESVPAHNGHRNRGLPKPEDDGTTFLVTEGKGDEKTTPFITLNTNSTLRGVCLYWPEQNINDVPEEYPWGIAMRGKNPAVLDVEMLNPYNGIDATQNERALIRNVHGQPLRRGIYVNAIYDIGRIENVHFNPWWSMQEKLFQWQMHNGEAFIFEKTDWHYVLNTFCFGYKVGYRFAESPRGGCNGNFLGIGADDCHTAILVEQSEPMGILITNGEFVSFHGPDPTMLEVRKTNKGTVRFSNCAFWGPCNQIAKISGTGTIGFGDCTFMQWDSKREGRHAIQVESGTVLVRGCEFKESKNQIELKPNVSRAVVSDNVVNGSVRIKNESNGQTSVHGNVGTAK